MTLGKYLLFPLLLTFSACSKQADPPSAREMYDSMSKMVTGSAYPSHWCTIIVVIVTTITIKLIVITIVTIFITILSPHRHHRWEERNACLASLSPTLESTMDKAWAGMRQFWTSRGQEGDTW